MSFVGISVLIMLFFFGIFALVYWRNKTGIASGFFFLCSLASVGLFAFAFTIEYESTVTLFILLALAVLLLLILSFGLYVLIIFLLFNARAVFKRERRSLANSLTLILALALIAANVLSVVLLSYNLPDWIWWIQGSVYTVTLYYFFHIMVFLTSLLLCNLARPSKKQTYIVVLGSGLIDGQVPPLLAGRIDKAIQFYNKQKQKRQPPKLVMSGGQGADEPLPEARAMRLYALQKGIPSEDILIEDQSVNTLQNMSFSRKIMEEDAAGAPFRCIYSTSNYHLLRAGIYAKKADLRMDGIGSKTAFYYLPNALLREYIAFLRMHLKRNIIIVFLLFFGTFFTMLSLSLIIRFFGA